MMPLLLLALRLQDGDAAERIRALEAQVELLRKENLALKRTTRTLEDRLTELAEHLVRPDAGAGVAQVAVKPRPAVPVPGPSQPLKAKVRVINSEYKFVILNAGEALGVEKGFRFEVSRDGARVALLEIDDANLDEQGRMSKARVVEGDLAKLIVGDEAIAHRVGAPNVETVDEFRDALKAVEASKARVSGRVENRYMLTVGVSDGLSVGDTVYVYRGGRLRAALKLQLVDKGWSLGARDDSTQNEEIFEGDLVSLKKLGPALAGRICTPAGTPQGIFIDLGLRDGARPGQTFTVSRLGKTTGSLRLQNVNEHWSTAEPLDGAAPSLFEKGDYVELAP